MMARRQRPATGIRTIIGGLGALFLAACSASAGSEKPVGHEAVKVTLAVAAPSGVSHLPVVLADRLGYFAEKGLDVRLVDFEAGSKVLTALLAGDADVASGFYGDTISMAAKGKSLRSFVTTINSPGLALAVSPRTNRRINRLADLKGAVVGVSAPGSGTHIALNYLLRRDGLGSDDVAVTGIGLAGTAVAAMERGQVDAAVLLEPALSQLEQRVGGLKLLVDTREPATVNEIFGGDGFPAIGLFTRSDWLAGNPATARKLAAAVTRALHWVHAHSATETADAMPAEYAGPDRALYLTTIASATRTVSVDGRMSVAGAEAVRRMLAVSVPEVAAAEIDLAATFTNEFVESP